LKKVIGIVLSLLGMAAFATASAADLPLKAKPKPSAEPTWWVSGGALLWAVKSTPLPPTLTTFAAGSPSATTGFGGVLGVAGTSVLSPDHLNYGPFGGGRFTLGHWLADPRFGVEVDGFFLAGNSAGFSNTSNGTVPLRIPFFNVSPPALGFPLGPSSFVLADPAFAAGGQSISSSLQLWGIEGNGLYRAVTSGPLSVSVLAGFRYLDLREGLSIVSTENQLAPGGTFVGSDNFSTKNQFFGGQIGVKAQREFGQFDASATAKVALGDNYQTVSINGFSTSAGIIGSPPFSLGGVFSQPTNIGQQTRNQFAVVPEAQIQVGYRLQNGVRFFAGYDFLYVSNVVRPGNQIDTTINFLSNPTLAGAGNPLTGAARPAPLFNGSSFWAQGVKLGASYAF
jgi:hypothetical protein